MDMATLSFCPDPVSERPFRGLGAQIDNFIYDDVNRRMGVTDEHLALFERRTAALRPGVARIFFNLDVVNPSMDGRQWDWSSEPARALVEHLRRLAGLGTRLNINMAPWSNAAMQKDGMETAAVEIVDHLRNVEGLDAVDWLCLFNEPDSMYYHDSPLYRRVFAGRDFQKMPTWEDYVRKNVRAYEELQRRGLDGQVQLVVADTVWGHPIRTERMRLAAEAFGGMDVAYSYHHYNPEYPEYYDPWEYDYPGMAEEATMFRKIVGDDPEMMIWEFNNAGPGFGSHFPGTGRHGEDLLGSYDSAVEISDKVITALRCGVDGMCLWCLADCYYHCGPKAGPMRFGLWRYRWEGYRPRPYFYYYAAIVRALRPGDRLHAPAGRPEGVEALAAEGEDGWKVLVLNVSREARRVVLDLPGSAGPWKRQRVLHRVLPTADEMPVEDWHPAEADAGRVTIDLEETELSVLASA